MTDYEDGVSVFGCLFKAIDLCIRASLQLHSCIYH